MGRRAGLNETVVVDAAIELVNQDGLEKLSIGGLAGKLGVRPPSLYNHIDGMEGLYRAMTLKGLRELTAVMQTAVMGRAGYDALEALANAYRDFAKAQPGLHTLTLRSTENEDEALRQQGQNAINVALAVLRGYGLEGDAALHATRCLRSAMQGFVSLELNGGFALALDLDESYRHLLQTLDCGFRTGFR